MEKRIWVISQQLVVYVVLLLEALSEAMLKNITGFF